MNELQHSLQSMGVVQYLFAVAFLISYVFALGGFLGPAARGRVWAVGALSAMGFSAFADRWEHGVLMTLFAVAGIGFFIGAAWALKAVVMTRYGEPVATGAGATMVSDQFETSELVANNLVPAYLPDYRVSDEHAAVEYARG